MELDQVSGRVSLALDALSALQAQVARNIAGISRGAAEVRHTGFSTLLSHLNDVPDDVDRKMSIVSLTEQLSQSQTAGATQMADEVLISQRLAGKYGTVIEAYNRQLALYRLAITGRG